MRWVSSIDFFLGTPYTTLEVGSGEVVDFNRCTIRGPRTFRKYDIEISGSFVSFSIRLQPTGLYGLLGIPASNFRNQAIGADSVLPRIFEEITERLMGCATIDECVAIVEPYLLTWMHGRKERLSSVQIAQAITSQPVPPSVQQLQHYSGLSQRQLERNFMKEVGTTPKMYARVVRFTNSVRYKISHPAAGWASVAYEFNYFDQMHLIRDFKEFLHITPSAFNPSRFAF
jgi:AraC-like DNA-binding protein